MRICICFGRRTKRYSLELDSALFLELWFPVFLLWFLPFHDSDVKLKRSIMVLFFFPNPFRTSIWQSSSVGSENNLYNIVALDECI